MSIWAADSASHTRPADRAPAIHEFIGALRERIGRDGLTVMIEPGRSIVGPAGVLLTQVLHRKKSPAKEFVIVDAAMNDLIRPSLYKAHHEILPLRQCPTAGTIVADVVGPVCETGRFSGARPGDGGRAAGRVSGGRVGRRIWVRAVVELQFAAARG